MNRLTTLLFVAGLSFFIAVSAHAQTAGTPAAFARMGFAARGVGLGNAGSAVIMEGESHPYYNPAAVGFTEFFSISATYTYLPLDRRLNFLSFTGKIGPTAGLGAAWVNSGVSNIDGRDNDGNRTETYSTSENLFLISFAQRVDENVSIGISGRGYLATLFDRVKANFSLGFDAGIIYRAFHNDLSTLTLGASVSDINSQYRWDTAPIYQQQGVTTRDRLPLALKGSAAYAQEGLFGMKTVLIATEFRFLTATFDGQQREPIIESGVPVTVTSTRDITRSEAQLAFGVMVQPVRQFRLRVGIDRIGLQGVGFTEISRGTAGFTFEYPVQTYLATIDYAILFEPSAPAGASFISLGVRF
jgi:hypothetical protein